MKQILLVLGVFAICSLPLSAKATEEISTQTADDNRALVAVQKQPSKDNKQQANRNWLCVVIQINGKVKDSDTSDINK